MSCPACVVLRKTPGGRSLLCAVCGLPHPVSFVQLAVRLSLSDLRDPGSKPGRGISPYPFSLALPERTLQRIAICSSVVQRIGVLIELSGWLERISAKHCPLTSSFPRNGCPPTRSKFGHPLPKVFSERRPEPNRTTYGPAVVAYFVSGLRT